MRKTKTQESKTQQARKNLTRRQRFNRGVVGTFILVADGLIKFACVLFVLAILVN